MKIHHFIHQGKISLEQFRYSRSTEGRYSASGHSQILQSTKTEIRISYPADECLAKGSILELYHPADKGQAMDSTL